MCKVFVNKGLILVLECGDHHPEKAAARAMYYAIMDNDPFQAI